MEQIPLGSDNGIEATDLVSLLCRFEEATKPDEELITPVLTTRAKPLSTNKNDGAFVSPSALKKYSSIVHISKCEIACPTNLAKTNYDKVQKISLLKRSIPALKSDGLPLLNFVGSQNSLQLNPNHLTESGNINGEFVTVNQTQMETICKSQSHLGHHMTQLAIINLQVLEPAQSTFNTDGINLQVSEPSQSTFNTDGINLQVSEPSQSTFNTDGINLQVSEPSQSTFNTDGINLQVSEPSQSTFNTDGINLQVSEPSQSTFVCHEISSADQVNHTLKRKIHGNGKQSKVNHHNSFAEEDDGYFEKIPSYYTALSIPSKPMKTTVFESAATSVGRDDHIDLVDRGEHFDELQFNKVPAHRRCFTNTVKEVDIDAKNYSCSQDEVVKTREESLKYSYSRSPSPHDYANNCSLSPSRYSRSHTRGSFRSSSVSSDTSSCSTCSSVSYCSTCNNSGRSRSRSLSSCSSCSNSPVRKISRSRSPDVTRKNYVLNKKSRISFSPHHDRHSRSRSSVRKEKLRSHSPSQAVIEKRKARQKDRENAMEERRVVYVGKIPSDYTKRQLYQRFECFGEIKEVKLNFREHGDNYGFVTFAYACDAIAAKERGNNTSDPVKFDLCFGGRRRFCADQYADLDGNQEVEEEYAPMPKRRTDELDFSDLLRLHTRNQNKKCT
ncbi:hypothetical protein Btru_016838 [Bulinus truncatus]|nr:hypothetical protein Btru_016838 [Bulinus truncatus]